MVTEQWLPAYRRWARAEHALGRLPEADRWLLDDGDDSAKVNGYRRAGAGWVETEGRSRHCVRHPVRLLAPGDRLYCPECGAEADTPGDGGTECGLMAPAPPADPTAGGRL
jgi:hypothetical protein